VAALDEYRRKRNPAATSEPIPSRGAVLPAETAAGNSFVIQEHHASALHWDFRLERDGVLVSWAVPKGLPTDPSVNRLAVHVEDHPLEYASYEGNIGHGQYGAGAVTIWDAGTYVTEKWSDREVKIVLAGRRVQGRFVLFQTGGNQWMMHRMDGPPRPDWQTLPAGLTPMRAVPGSLPRGAGWAYEMGWPGVRAIGRVEGGRLDLADAAGDDIGPKFPELRQLAEALGTVQALFDGVIVHFGAETGPESVRARVGAPASRVRRLAETEPVTYLIFDLTHLDGRSLLDSPYRERRTRLEELAPAGPVSQVPPVFEGHGREALRASHDQGLAGVVAKRLTSPYRPGESSPDWIAISA
jgi:bifunctional non-homologous end joining protein LigD